MNGGLYSSVLKNETRLVDSWVQRIIQNKSKLQQERRIKPFLDLYHPSLNLLYKKFILFMLIPVFYVVPVAPPEDVLFCELLPRIKLTASNDNLLLNYTSECIALYVACLPTPPPPLMLIEQPKPSESSNTFGLVKKTKDTMNKSHGNFESKKTSDY